MNECFTDPIFGNLQCWKEKVDEGRSAEEEGEEVEGEVNYSVSGDLQIT